MPLRGRIHSLTGRRGKDLGLNPRTHPELYWCLMAKLYTKVNSDIRAGLGVRGDKNMDASLLFSYSGGRSADGGVRVIATATKGGYAYKIMRISGGSEELYGTITFKREGRERGV